MQRHLIRRVSALAVVTAISLVNATAQAADVWGRAQREKDTLQIATLFVSHQVDDLLAGAEGLRRADAWCRASGITHVYIETFRGKHQAEPRIVAAARDFFRDKGYDVSGCITTNLHCFTTPANQVKLELEARVTAGLFDQFIIDDFFFNSCKCELCEEARGERSWAEYNCELMLTMGRQRVVAPAREVNPDVNIIFKYPLWYESFQLRGYDPDKQTELFDDIYVGTETRDWDGPRGDRKPQYQAYFIMRWLGEIGGAKTRGGWFDFIDTTRKTYLEQAVQTTLADAPELFLFNYGSLTQRGDLIEEFRASLPALFELAKTVRNRPIRGITAPKPIGSDAYPSGDQRGAAGLGADGYIFDFVGMMGLPLVPTHEIEPGQDAYFFSIHALADPDFRNKLQQILRSEAPVLMTDTLARELSDVDLDTVTILPVEGDCRNLLELTSSDLAPVRDTMLRPFGVTLAGPNSVPFYLMDEDLYVLANCNNRAATMDIGIPSATELSVQMTVPPEQQVDVHEANGHWSVKVPPRTTVVLKATK